MKDEEFKELLSKVAEWEIPNVNSGGNIKSPPKRGRKTKEEQYQEQHEQEFLDLFGGKNPTVHPVITKIKVAGCMCEDCGRFCESGRSTEVKRYITNNIVNWRERCTTCSMTKNPYTGKFDLEPMAASVKWNSYLKDTKGAYQSKGNLAKEQKTFRIVVDKNKTDK